MEEARFLSALVNKHRPGERSFDPRTDLDDWDALFEGVVLLQQRQDRSRFGSMTLRHATVQLYQQALTRDLIDPAIDPYYYGYSSELNAWSFEAACDPATQPMGRAFDHPWSIVRAVFPYAWGAQAERERHAWKAWLATLRPVLPGWSDGPG